MLAPHYACLPLLPPQDPTLLHTTPKVIQQYGIAQSNTKPIAFVYV